MWSSFEHVSRLWFRTERHDRCQMKERPRRSRLVKMTNVLLLNNTSFKDLTSKHLALGTLSFQKIIRPFRDPGVE